MCTRTLHDDMTGLYLDRAFHLRTEGGREGPLFLEVRVLCHRHFPGGNRVELEACSSKVLLLHTYTFLTREYLCLW